jgi:DNA-binding NtrC family response regulator
MPRTSTAAPLARLLDQSTRPLYVIDAGRRIVYCNTALTTWMALETDRIIGRAVEYHSVPAAPRSPITNADGPLSELCPPPRAFFGETCSGTISCMAPDGRLVHRLAEFKPLQLPTAKSADDGRAQSASAVLVLLAGNDLTPQELTSQLTEISVDSQADELHRTIRQFRRAQATMYTIESLLGASAPMRKVRAQIAAAAASCAHVLVSGPPGSGRGHVARAIHYQAASDAPLQLLPYDCRGLNDGPLRRALEGGLRSPAGLGSQRPTLLLENLECLAPPFQKLLLSTLQQRAMPVRVLATLQVGPPSRGGHDAAEELPAALPIALVDALSTISIRLPRLVDRMEDLPILAQYFLESCNHGSDKQVGSIRPEALDLLALHTWPRELDELREVVSAAHRACNSHEIAVVDLPPVIHHAAQAASHAKRRPDRVVLDELLASIEKEVVVRALAQVGGNKSAAAELLGMTRPRLYRRMVQLGLITEPATKPQSGPEFIERDPADQAP